MAEARPRLIAVPPNANGIAAGLRDSLRAGSIVTAHNDGRLRLASQLLDVGDDVEVIPFGELVSRVLRMLGEPLEKTITRGQRLAVTQLACESLQGDSPLERSARFPGMVRAIASNLETLRHFGVGQVALQQAADRGSEAQREKFRVLQEIVELVRDSMEVSHREYTSDRAVKCLDKKLPVSPLQHVVVIAGPDQAPVFDAWTVWLAEQGIAVDVMVDLVPGRTDLFLPSVTTAARIQARHRTVVGEAGWYEALFSDQTTVSGPDIEVFSACDPMAECEWMVRRCRRLMDAGVSASDIGIYLRDQETYTPLVTDAAAALGVPLSGGRSVPLLSCGLALTVLQVLQAANSRDTRKFAALAKTSYCRADRGVQESLYRLALAREPAGPSPWEEIEAWAAREGTEIPVWIGRLLEWRKSAVSRVATLTAWLDRLRALVGDTQIFDTAVIAEESVRARDLRAQTVLQRAIADLAFVYDQAGREELDLAGFVRTVERVWDGETVVVDEGRVGVKLMFDSTSIEPVSTLFVPGMLEGFIPRRRREDPLLDDDDLALLSQVTGLALPDSRETVRAERDQFVRLCAAPSTRLVLSHPLTNEDQENIPAFYLQELRRAVNGRTTETDHPRPEWLPQASECFIERDARLRAAFDGPRCSPPQTALSETFSRDAVTPDFEQGVSPSELSATLRCPFEAAFRYRLDVKPPGRRAGIAQLFEIPRLARLVEARDRNDAEGRLRGKLTEILTRLSPVLEEWEADLMQATGERLVTEWIEREFAARSVWPREDGSAVADVSLGTQGLKDSPVVGGRAIRLKAAVAGVSQVGGVSVVHTYAQRLPDTTTFEDQVTTDDLAFELGLILMAQHGRGPRGQAVDLDSSTGERRLLVLSSNSPYLRSDAVNHVHTRVIGESPSTLYRAVKQRLREAVATLELREARATPGDHCARCLYGEICRVSREYGEDNSPFGEDTT